MAKKNDIYIRFSETEIQKEICSRKEEFFYLIDIPKFKVLSSNSKIWEPLYSNIISEYEDNYEHLEYLEFVAKELPLEKKDDNTIRADFLGYVGGGHGIAICELKKSQQTERQAFTELLAYANHLGNKFSPMGKRDVFHILIAPMKERIVREAMLNSLLYGGLKIIALIPYLGNVNDIHSLRFKVWIPSEREFALISAATFVPENFNGVRVAWKGKSDVWIPSQAYKNPSDIMKHRMNKLANYAAQQMEAMGINGFVFASQKWSEIKDRLDKDCSLSVFAINPYKASARRLLHDGGIPIEDLEGIPVEDLPLKLFLPSLNKKNSSKESNDSFGEMLIDWGKDIAELTMDSVQLFTSSVTGGFETTEYEEYDWESFLRNPFEDKYAHNFDIIPTGLLRIMYVNYLHTLIHDIRKSDDRNEYLDLGIVEDELVDMINDQEYFRGFLKKTIW